MEYTYIQASTPPVAGNFGEYWFNVSNCTSYICNGVVWTATALEDIKGLSTDTKPTTDISGVLLRKGCTFFAIDTTDVFIFDGISTWYAV